MKFVIAYDISDDKRRERIARVLLQFGERVQKSVFVAILDKEQQSELRRELGVLLRRNDTLEWFPIDRRNPDDSISWRAQPLTEDPVLVIE